MRHIDKPFLSRKQGTLVAVATVLTIALGGYGAASYTAWSSLTDSSRVASQQSKTVTERLKIVSKDSTVDSERRRSAISEIINSVPQQNCTIEPWFAWQTILPAIKSRYTSCIDNLARSKKQRDALTRLRDYLNDEQAIAQLLKKIQVPDIPLAESQWQAQHDAASTAKQLITNLKTSDTSQKIKDSTIARLSTIEQAWTALIAANQKQSPTEFTAASDSLAASYRDLSKLGALADQQLASLLDDCLSL